jgi:hypothetical protein
LSAHFANASIGPSSLAAEVGHNKKRRRVGAALDLAADCSVVADSAARQQ